MDSPSPTPTPVTPEITALMARLEESERQARMAESELSLSKMRIVQLEERLRLLRIAKYGPRSESLSAAQLALFEEEISATLDEVAAEAARGAVPPAPAAQRKGRKPHPGRQTLPVDLPRVVTVISCPPAQCTCGNCGAETAVIGYEESERLDVEPAKFFVTMTRREKRACRNCKQGGVATAPVAAEIVEKGLACNRVVVNAVVSKYCDHLPLYRQCVMLARDAGVEISRVTMDGWVMRVGYLLTAIVMAMRKEVHRGGYIQADETTVMVQRPEERKGRNHQAYLWQFGNPRGSVVFEFRLGRGAATADSFLDGYKGILQTDGYAGYDNAAKGVGVHAGCWAHLRRYFVDAVKVNKLDSLAAAFVVEMDQVFAVDREAAEAKMSLAERHALRQERTRPVVEGIGKKLLAAKGTVLPKSKLGEGVTYGLAQWPRMIAFLDHAEIELSNNLAENSMRPVAVGRKNWIHVGSVDAGPRGAAILSVVETCRRLDIPVRKYLIDVLPGLADRKASHVAELTPVAWKLRRSG
jgi:transposase